MSENKDLLLKMLADEPKLYNIINSKEHLLVLEILEKDNKNFQFIKNVLEKDIYIKKDIIIYNILDSLIDNNLIKKIKVNESDIYFLTEKGKSFLKLFKQTKQEFSLM
jgi:DNA-binding PadR family transcriptional regulator